MSISIEVREQAPNHYESPDTQEAMESLGDFMARFQAIEASQLPVDELLQKRASSLIGSVAISQFVGVEELPTGVDKPQMTLQEATVLASKGNLEAREMVEVNARIDYVERAYKSGFFCPSIELQKLPDGTLIQNGQTLEEVHTNSLRYMDNPKLKERSKVEALNAVRDQYYSESGLLKDNMRIIMSMVHDKMNDTEASQSGFFVPTRSLAIQVLTEHEGKTIAQVAFVSGVDPEAGIFDNKAAIAFAKKLGINYSGSDSEEILGRPLLVNKSVMPKFIVSATQMFDEAATEVTGLSHFMGEVVDQSVGEEAYTSKFTECQEVITSMQKDVSTVVQKLIQWQPKSPTEATSKLAELNDQLVKSRILEDVTIDSRALGTRATWSVEHGRALMRDHADRAIIQNDLRFLRKEINRGTSSSCPGGASVSKNEGIIGAIGDVSDGDEDDKIEAPEDCEFVSKQCPKCNKKNVKTTCKDGKYFGDCGCSSD